MKPDPHLHIRDHTTGWMPSGYWYSFRETTFGHLRDNVLNLLAGFCGIMAAREIADLSNQVLSKCLGYLLFYVSTSNRGCLSISSRVSGSVP